MNTITPLDHGITLAPPTLEQEQEILKQKRAFHSNLVHINRGKGALAFLIVVEIIGFVISLYSGETATTVDMVISLVIILTYIGLLILSNQYAYQALLFSTGLYLFFLITLFIFEPFSLFRGILIKGVMIYFFIQGIRYAKMNRAISESLKKYGEQISPVLSRR